MKNNFLIQAQRNEATEHQIYLVLAKKTKDSHNKKILQEIAADEAGHYIILKKETKQDVKPSTWRVRWYTFLAHVLGVAFALRLMERGETWAQELYKQQKNGKFKKFLLDEHKHEKALIGMLKDQRVEYAGSIVLGLNDALVELTGALAGLSLALANNRLIAIIGCITGFAAALSMAASEYLSSKEDGSGKQPLRGAFYTGVAYLVTVALLVLPFILLDNNFMALTIMLCTTVIIIGLYTFYISTAKALPFWPRFGEMMIISLGVTAISFCVGWIVRTYIGIDA